MLTIPKTADITEALQEACDIMRANGDLRLAPIENALQYNCNFELKGKKNVEAD